MQLSNRLKAITEFVSMGSTLADIGCDHAFVSIYLVHHKIANHVVALDINKGPLERASQNVKKYGYEEEIELRLSDGAKKLQPGEVDTILIAGMGGSLMVKILSDSPLVVNACQELVLSPQSEVFLVREYLHQIGFQIVEEDMLIDEGKFYTILKAVKGSQTFNKFVFYKYGKLLLEDKNQTLNDYLKLEKLKIIEIADNLKMEATSNSIQRLSQLQKELKYCEEGLKYYEM